jgi:hypothetical protein
MTTKHAIGNSPLLVEKMNVVLNMFLEKKNDFERTAEQVPDASVKSMILALAQESNQYAAEWQSQIYTLGGKTELDKAEKQDSPVAHFQNCTDVITFCDSNENKMVNAYQEMLDLPELYEGLKKMISYQLEGIHSAFMQFRLLGSLRPFSL